MLTKERLNDIIKRRYVEGKTLSIERIDGEEYSKWQIHEAAKKYYGGWTKALIDCGIKPNEQALMSKEEAIIELRRLQKEGHSMKVVDFDTALYRAINKHFGGYMNAKKELGIRNNRRKGSGGHRKRKLDDVIAELKSKAHLIGSKKDYREICGKVYRYSREHLGSPYAIFELAGLEEPSDTKSSPAVWTEDKIRHTLGQAVKEWGTTSSNQLINKGYRTLVDAVKRHYGTWNAGLVALGYEVAYEYRSPDDNLTKEQAKEKVIKALSKGIQPTRKALENEIRGLSRIIDEEFDGISGLKEYCGFCTLSERHSKREEVVKRYRPKLTTTEGIRREIIRMWYIGSPMNYSYVRERRRHLIEAANKHIGSWKQAVESVGIKYDEVSKQNNTNELSECGIEFEEIFAEILTELGYEFAREGEGIEGIFEDFALKPDFILPNWRWIDCKLSEWTDIRETIIRYHDENPNGITIVYLRGRNRKVNRGRKWRYEHVSVYQFTKLLPKDRRDYYEKRLREIEERANEGAVAM